jgi:hypothetical protein
MKLTKPHKRMLVHATYTSLIILVGLFIYDGGNVLRNKFSQTYYFKSKPIELELLLRSLHVLGIFIFDLLLVYIIYKYFKILY